MDTLIYEKRIVLHVNLSYYKHTYKTYKKKKKGRSLKKRFEAVMCVAKTKAK